MAVPKLYYFNARGKGEFIRLVFKAGGQEFEDIVINYGTNEWLSVKPAAPFGQLPYVEYNGRKYAQSLAIARFFSKRLGLYGNSDQDEFQIDQAVEVSEDIRRCYIKDWYWEQDPTKKAELKQKMIEEFPRFLGYFETLLKDNGNNGHLVGEALSLADIHFYDMLDTIVGLDGDALASFPNIQKLRKTVEAVPAIKSYLEVRTPRPI